MLCFNENVCYGDPLLGLLYSILCCPLIFSQDNLTIAVGKGYDMVAL